MVETFASIRQQIMADPENASYTTRGIEPLYTVGASARIMIVGQAPGRLAEAAGVPWKDASGRILRGWLGLTEEQFYNPDLVALVPMDFYFPGMGVHGDQPPRADFAAKWHPLLRSLMPQIDLTILIGQYSQKYYLGERLKRNLTETVRAYEEYLPNYFPLVHSSPRNFRWQAKNPWFATEVVPVLQQLVAKSVR